MCGGTRLHRLFGVRNRGLSPRVRGNLRVRGVCRDGGGSIPACAGEPMPAGEFACIVTVYPRVCGGTAVRQRCHRKMAGLSPRVRGNPLPGSCFGRPRRSIPACAGEPRRGSGDRARASVYPRVCGGTPVRATSPLSSMGLSPRVRGNRVAVANPAAGDRSIPACAGEPDRIAVENCLFGVYPRVCGGTHSPSTVVPLETGLSPRVRGNPRSWARTNAR